MLNLDALDPERWQRLCTRHALGRKELLVIVLFGFNRRETGFVTLLRDFIQGRSAAAVAAGRTPFKHPSSCSPTRP